MTLDGNLSADGGIILNGGGTRNANLSNAVVTCSTRAISNRSASASRLIFSNPSVNSVAASVLSWATRYARSVSSSCQTNVECDE